MAISLKHAFTSAKSDGADATQVQPSNWNAEHTLTLAADRVLGRDASGAGAVQEITCTAYGRGIIASADVAAWKTATGLQATSMTWTEAHTFNGSLTAGKAVFATGVISPTALSADTNDWAPTDFATSTHVRASTTANYSLTGLAGGATGRLIQLHNVGSFALKLVSDSNSSTAANRFAIPRDTTLFPNDSVTLIYDGTSSRWRLASPLPSKAPTVTRLTSGTSQTYTTPFGATRLKVRMVGPGGGGGGSGTGSPGAGQNGGNSTATSFGSTTADYGDGGAASTTAATDGGIGGTGGSTGTGTEVARYRGSAGLPSGTSVADIGGSTRPLHSGGGGDSVFGGAGRSRSANNASNAAGEAAQANSGSGGAGALRGGAPANERSAAGGGAGEFVEFIISAPSATYTYTVPAGGTGGTAGTSGSAGGAGGSGVIIVEEFYD